jgi:hypothetical protein
MTNYGVRSRDVGYLIQQKKPAKAWKIKHFTGKELSDMV